MYLMEKPRFSLSRIFVEDISSSGVSKRWILALPSSPKYSLMLSTFGRNPGRVAAMN